MATSHPFISLPRVNDRRVSESTKKRGNRAAASERTKRRTRNLITVLARSVARTVKTTRLSFDKLVDSRIVSGLRARHFEVLSTAALDSDSFRALPGLPRLIVRDIYYSSILS